MKFDINKINDYINKGLIIKQNHPTFPISIYNYSRECQYNNLWDDLTISCRGLILDNDGKSYRQAIMKLIKPIQKNVEN